MLLNWKSPVAFAVVNLLGSTNFTVAFGSVLPSKVTSWINVL